MKRTLALLVAVGGLAAAAAASRAVDASRDRTVQRESARAAETAGLRANDALASHVKELKLEAQSAATSPRLVAALRGNVDAATLQDLFRTEEWWAPVRRAFRIYAVALDGEKLDVIEGMQTADFASNLIVRAARERKEVVAEVVIGKGWPYAAAAAPVVLPGRDLPAVLLLARPIDDAAVRKLADKAGAAVLLSDGQRAVLEAGPDAERALLRTAIGAEAKGPIHEGTTGAGWAASVSPLVPGLWLWTFASGAAAAADAASAAATTKVAIWSAAGVLALVGLFVGLRRRPAAALPPSASEVTRTVPEGPRAPATGASRRPLPPAVAAAAATMPAAPRTRAGLGMGAAPAAVPGGTAVAGEGPASLGNAGRGGPIQFGRYLLLDLLGEGGMAQVYTAVAFGAEGFRRTFVVKRLRAEIGRDATVVAQFIDEANLASTLVHSNIIPVFDFGKVGEEYFLAQEYILGRDLGRLTARVIERQNEALSPTVTLFAAAETLRALEYAHAKLGDNGRPLSIVHRDVSPSNILISARGEVKLFDFGIVKAEGRVTQTQHGVVKGNVSFMSPEQARGIGIDARADLFSLGLVIFYCLTGELLYHGNTTYELLMKAATGPGPDELARIARLPAPCAQIVAKALEINPAKRFQSAAEFGAAVSPHVKAGGAEALALMDVLFADDFRVEERRFAAAMPNAASAERRRAGEPSTPA